MHSVGRVTTHSTPGDYDGHMYVLRSFMSMSYDSPLWDKVGLS